MSSSQVKFWPRIPSRMPGVGLPPITTLRGGGLLYNNYSPNLPVHDDTWQWDQRVDWNISAKDQTFVRYSYTHEQVGYTPPLGPVIDGDNEA